MGFEKPEMQAPTGLGAPASHFVDGHTLPSFPRSERVFCCGIGIDGKGGCLQWKKDEIYRCRISREVEVAMSHESLEC